MVTKYQRVGMPLNEFRRRSSPMGATLFNLMHVNGAAFTDARECSYAVSGRYVAVIGKWSQNENPPVPEGSDARVEWSALRI